MDRDTLRRQLKASDARIAEAVANASRQRREIEKLKREGRDTTAASAKLQQLRTVAKNCAEERRQIAKQLISPAVWGAGDAAVFGSTFETRTPKRDK